MSNVTQAWLADPSHILGLLVEITAKVLPSGMETTFYLSNIGYTTTSADVTYLPYINGNIQTTESLTIDGSLSMSFGDIQINNYNGELDDWLDRTKYIWNSRAVKVYLGDPRWTAATLSDVRTIFEKVFDGVVEDVDSSSRESLNIKVRDKLNRLNYPITDNTLGIYGTWAGGQTNQDTIRPLVFGEVFNLSPVLVDPAYLEYMFNDTSVGTLLTSTTTSTNLITCTSTAGFILNAPVVFTFSTTAYPSTFGNLVFNTTYYVKTIDSSTTFTVSTTSGGATFALTSASLTTTGSLVNEVKIEVNVYSTELGIEIRDNGVPIYTDLTVYGTTITSTAATTNRITCASTQNLSVGMSIIFDTSIGNIMAGVTYYVKTIVSSIIFTISELADGNALTLTTAIASGTIRARNINRPDRAIVNLTSGKFTLKSPPDGTVTISLQGLKQSVDLTANGTASLLSAYNNNIANIITLIVTQYGQVSNRLTSSDLDLVNLRAFVATNTAATGIVIKDRVNILEVCQKLARSANAQLFFNRLGLLQLLQLGTYTLDGVMGITDADIMHHSLHISSKTKITAATKVGYALNYTPQTALAGSIPTEANFMFNDEWYSQTVTDTGIQATYKLTATPVQIDTNLIRGSDATALATTLNEYFKVPHTVYAFTGTAKLFYLKLGQRVTLTHNRFGLSAGKTGQVITLSPNWADGTINVEVII